jgi:predicted CXXCH cytochrome family protein
METAGGARDAHDRVTCSRCHTLAAKSEQGGRRPIDPVGACRDCHDIGSLAGETSLSPAFHTDPGRSCRDCHSFHRTERISVGKRQFAFQFGDAALQNHCASCHTPAGRLWELSEGHRIAADLYHVDYQELFELSPSEGCLRCHSTKSPPVDLRGADLRTPRFNEGASHPLGVLVTGSGNRSNQVRYELDSRLQLFDRRIECQTCHLVASSTDDLLVWFGSKYEFCRGCHQHESGDHARPVRFPIAD